MLIFSFSITQAQQPSFRIGILDAPDGQVSQGALLAIEQINNEGGVLGADGTRFLLEPIIQGPDVFGSISTAVSNLRSASVVAVIGPVSPTEIDSNLSALQRFGIPIITPVTSDNLLARDTSELIMRSRSAEVLLGRALASVLVQDIGARDIQPILLDSAATAGLVGFTSAAQSLGATNRQPLLGLTSTQYVERIMQSNPPALVIYGAVDAATEVIIGLRNARFGGLIAYNDADSPEFRALLPTNELDGIISATSWSFGLSDAASTQFLVDFVRRYGRVPGPIDAAGYDSVVMIAEALSRPGVLADNLLAITGLQGAQGALNPATLPLGETSDNTSVIRHTSNGGVSVLARFVGSTRVQGEDNVQPPIIINRATATPRPTNTPQPTATPDGVTATIKSQVLNVRTGPSTVYDAIGQLRNAEQVRLIGANVNVTWGVIVFRGTNAWISLDPSLVDVVGDRRSLPIVAAPPTPTPGPTSTPAPTATNSQPDPVVVSVSPNILVRGQNNAITVTVQNGGGATTGQFAIAASFEPGAVFSGVTIPNPGLTPGQAAAVQLQALLNGATGFYQTPIIADLNSEVNEGPGENNNSSFIYAYKLDQITASTGQITVNSGFGLNLDGLGGNDLVFNGGAMQTAAGCTLDVANCIGTLTVGLNFDSAHYDIISSISGVNSNSVNVAPGQTIGLYTDNGRRVVIRIDSASPAAVTFTYRVYGA
jgi:ABC-type branched-subunit amino acid transport system substrate-binding protein